MDRLHGPDAVAFERAAEVFSLLSTASRLRMLCVLCEREMCVGELAMVVDLSHQDALQQLASMCRAGLLARRDDGSQVYYSVQAKTKEFLCNAVQSVTG